MRNESRKSGSGRGGEKPVAEKRYGACRLLLHIFLDPLAFKPPLGKNGIDRELKKLRDAVGAYPALAFVEKESQTIGGFGRNARFSYAQRLCANGYPVYAWKSARMHTALCIGLEHFHSPPRMISEK